MANFLSLEWGEQIVGVEASVQRDSVQVQQSFVLDRSEIPEGTEAGDWLRAALAELGVSAKQAVVSLPRQDVVVRNLELPPVSDEELPDMVRFQAGTKSSLPLDQMSVDFLPLPRQDEEETRSVMVATIPNDVVTEIGKTLSVAGIDLKSLGVGPVALTEMVVKNSAVEGTGLVVAVDDARLDLTIHQDGTTVFSHSANLGADSDQIRAAGQAVSRALFAAGNSLPGVNVTQAHLLGSLADSLSETVRARLSGPAHDADVSVVSLQNSSLFNFGQDLGELAGSPALAAVLGQLLSVEGQLVERIDFLNPHKPPKAASRVSSQNLLRVAIGLLLAAGAIYGIRTLRTRSLDKQIATTRARVQLQEMQFLDKPEPDAKLPSTVAVSKWMDQRIQWLDQLDELTQLFGKSDELVFTELNLTQDGVRGSLGRININGLTAHRRPIQDLRSNVRDNPHYQLMPTKLDENKDRGTESFRWRFSKITIDVTGKAKVRKPEKSKKKSQGQEKDKSSEPAPGAKSTTASTGRTGS